MTSSDYDESLVLAEWAEEECTHLDLIASWEELTGVYDYLHFTGPESDEVRLEEFKFIIGEMNKFLTRMRNGLARTRHIDDAITFLIGHLNTRDMSAVTGRKEIAYNKLKQQWIRRAGVKLTASREAQFDEGKRDD
jgi:hypothetical protein